MPQIGEFDSHLRPLSRLILRGNARREQTVKARLDTGFDLSLAVPEVVIDAPDVEYVKTRSLQLASSES